MINAILGIKKGMSVRFDQYGRRLPVTVIEADSNVVVLRKDQKVLLGLGRKKKAKKTENAFVSAAGYAPRFMREVGLDSKSGEQLKIGDKVMVSIFEPQDEVKVTGVTRGKGFAGGVKRWGFAGGPKTHGQSDRHRAPGSIGQTTTPGRVFRGKRMAGHMGVDQLTVGGLEVIEVDADKNLLVIKGSVPGAKGGFLKIEKTGKVKGYTPPPAPSEQKEEESPKENEEVQTRSTSDDKSQSGQITQEQGQIRQANGSGK